MYKSFTQVGTMIEVFVGRSKRMNLVCGKNQCFDNSMVAPDEEEYTRMCDKDSRCTD